MNVIFSTTLIVILCIVISGCATTDTNQSSVTYTEQTPQVDQSITVDSLSELMRFYDSLHEKKTHQLAEEYKNAKSHLIDSSNTEGRLKYILLISIPNTAHTDIKAALVMLKNWPQEAILPPNLASFRNLLIMLFTEQQKDKTSVRYLLQQLKTSEEHAQTLQKKIDAIKSMEKSPLRRINP